MTQDESVIQLVVLLVAIVGVGVSLALMIQNASRESRREVSRIQDRVTGIEGDLRDRIAWIEGMLGASSQAFREGPVVRWRRLRRADLEGEDQG